MDVDAETVRRIRCKFFETCPAGSAGEESDEPRVLRDSDMHPVFPSVPGGPRLIYASLPDADGKRVPWVPGSEEELLAACVSSMTADERDDKWTVPMSELQCVLETEAFACGVAVHLLHRYPFSLLRDVSLDAKSRVHAAGQPVSLHSKVRMAVETLTRRTPAVWVAVKTERQYAEYFRSASPLEDPLAEAASATTPRSLPGIMRLGCDQPFHPNCAGLYVVAKQSLDARASFVLGSFGAYAPVRIGEPIGPLDANIVMRVRCAAKQFDYGYTIEKDGCRRGDMAFLRVPTDFCFEVNRVLRSRGGRCSLNRLLADLVAKYLPGTSEETRYVAAEKMLRLLKSVSMRNGPDLEVRRDTPWIFFKNENLSGQSLDFDEANLGKHFWRSLPALCSHWDVDLSSSLEKPEAQAFAKKLVVGFPHACDLRDVADSSYMCRSRFEHHAAASSHVQEVHAITPQERSVLHALTSGRLAAETDECTPLYKWLESKGVLHVFDVDVLRKVERLGDIVADFVKIHTHNFQVVSDLKELHQELEQTRHVLELAQRDQTCGDRARKLEAEGQLYARYVQLWEKSLLHPDDLNRYLLSWLRALNLQTAVMTRFNEMTERRINAQAKAARMANIFTRDWNTQLNRAGCNLGSVSSKSYHQSLSDGKVCRGKQLPNVMLAMIASLQESREKGIAGAASAYKDFVEDAKVEPHEVGLPASLDGGATPLSPAGSDDASPAGTGPSPPSWAGERGADSTREDRGGDEEEGGDGLGVLARPGADALYRQVKMHETSNGMPVAPACDFRKLQRRHRESEKALLRVDARHFDAEGLKKFVLPGKSLYPGEDVLRFGKGSSPGEVAVNPLEICDPTNIHVDVRDCREVLFALLTLLKYKSPENAALAVVTFTKSLVNALDLMFQLSEKGRREMFTVIRNRLQPSRPDEGGMHRLKYRTWTLFVSSVGFLNSNFDQNLNELFRVRFHRHGDPSGVVVWSSGYDESYRARAGSTVAVRELFEARVDGTGPAGGAVPLQHAPKVLVQENHGRLFRDQRALVERTRATFLEEVANLKKKKKKRKGSPTLIEMPDKVPLLKKVHLGELVEDRHGSSGAATDVTLRTMPLAAVLDPEGKAMRSFDCRPVHVMTRREELVDYDREVNDFRRRICTICLEAFSNRPLEGFNCVYRKAEREYRRNRGIDPGVSILEDSKLYSGYLEYVGRQTAESGNVRRGDVESNGMHLFHKSCIRRLIQLEALNLRSDAVRCPYCRETVYDRTEKATLLSNLNDVACRLLLNLEDQLLADRSDDEMIDLKKPGVWDAKLVPREADMKDFKQYLRLDGTRVVDGPSRREYEEHLKDYLRLQEDSLDDPGSLFADACSTEASDDLCAKARAALDAGLRQCTALA